MFERLNQPIKRRKRKTTYETDFTQGPITRQLMVFAIPFLVSNIFQMLYGVVDMLVVGWFVGDTGITAVNISGQITTVFLNFVLGISSGATIIVSQYKGAGQQKDIKETIGTQFTLFAYIGIFFSVIGAALSKTILQAVNTPPEAMHDAVLYLAISMGGCVFTLGYNAVSGVLRGLGDSKRPMRFIIIATVSNIILVILFVGLFKMGTWGAALSTIISQAISFFLSIYTLRNMENTFSFKLKNFKIAKDKLRLILKIGMPSAMQFTFFGLSMLLLTSLINTYGVMAATAAGVGNRVNSFGILPVSAVTVALSAMVGQNMGAGKYERCRKGLYAGMVISFAAGVIMLIIVQVFPGQIMYIFGCSPEAADIGIRYLRLGSFFYVTNAGMMVFNAFMSGTGNTWMAMVNSMCASVVLRVPAALLFSAVIGMGLDGIFLSIGFTPLIGVVVGSIFIARGMWKKNTIGINDKN